MEPTTDVQDFFSRYASALLDRDVEALADLYAVPALIAFPGQTVPVSDRTQTRDFFAGSLAAYDGVTEAEPTMSELARTGHSTWVDVTWHYGGEPRERFVYQLLRGEAGWQIGVLTPLELEDTF